LVRLAPISSGTRTPRSGAWPRLARTRRGPRLSRPEGRSPPKSASSATTMRPSTSLLCCTGFGHPKTYRGGSNYFLNSVRDDTEMTSRHPITQPTDGRPRRSQAPVWALGPQWAAQGLRQPGWVLLPLRAFLGFTFCYAGLQKLANPDFFNAGSPGSVQHQMSMLAATSPIGPLVDLSLRSGPLVGILIAVGELAIGVGTLLGLRARWAAAAGAVLALTFFLTVSWNTTPYYYGADIVFLFAWTPFITMGAGGGALHGRMAGRTHRSKRGPRLTAGPGPAASACPDHWSGNGDARRGHGSGRPAGCGDPERGRCCPRELGEPGGCAERPGQPTARQPSTQPVTLSPCPVRHQDRVGQLASRGPCCRVHRPGKRRSGLGLLPGQRRVLGPQRRLHPRRVHRGL